VGPSMSPTISHDGSPGPPHVSNTASASGSRTVKCCDSIPRVKSVHSCLLKHVRISMYVMVQYVSDSNNSSDYSNEVQSGIGVWVASPLKKGTK